MRVEGWRGLRCDESDAGQHEVMKTITAKQHGRPLRRPDSGDGTRVKSDLHVQSSVKIHFCPPHI